MVSKNHNVILGVVGLVGVRDRGNIQVYIRVDARAQTHSRFIIQQKICCKIKHKEFLQAVTSVTELNTKALDS